MTYRTGLLAAASLLALLGASPAISGGPVTTPDLVEALPPPDDWSGFYLGIAAAQPSGDNTWDLPALALFLVPDRWSGSLTLLTLGHDWQRGRLTFGGALTLANGDISAAPQSDTFFTCFSCATEVSNLITLRGRTGLASGRMLYYASGGFARADVAATSGAGLTTVNSGTLTGWTLGVGVERRIGEKLSLTASYDHTDLGSLDLSGHVAGTVTTVDFGLMQIGLNYRW